MNAARALVVAAVVGLALAPAAAAHSGGKAEPRISAGLSGTGLSRDVVVRLTDVDSGEPIDGATVTAAASMSVPHTMQLAPEPVPQTGPGTYRGRIQLLMPAVWTFRIGVSGPKVVGASATMRARIGFFSSGSTATATSPPVATLPTRVEAVLTRTDYLTMAVLWMHGLAAMGWILGVVVMAVALASDPALLDDGVRGRLSRWYRRVGAWLHWALVPVIVATGIYNMQRVTPFSLAWSPAAVRRLVDVPYGALYEAILVVKLGLFAALLITGTQVLRRTLNGVEPSTEIRKAGALSTLRSSLGAPGLVYLSSVPLILAAAMALRYVHILSHVAVVLDQRS
jgi:uncharacterized membrane protein